MRIGIVTFFYRPIGGGIPRYVEDIANQFVRQGHSVDIITGAYDELNSVERHKGLTIYRLHCMNILLKSEEENIVNSKEFLKFLKKYSSKKKPDIFFAQNLHASISSIGHAFMLNIISLEKNIPLALAVHSFPTNPGKDLKLALLKNLSWGKIIPVSCALAENLHLENVPINRMNIVPCGVDLFKFKLNLGKKWLRSRIGASEKELVILHASRIDAKDILDQKGIKTLLKAFSLISQKTNLKLVFATAPSAPLYLESQQKNIQNILDTAKLLKIENSVSVVTFKPEEMPWVYGGADIFVMASQIESFGMVYAEALACGIPVIGTGVGGIPEIIEDNKSGFLIRPDDPIGLSKKLNLLIENAEMRRNFGEYGASQISKKYDLTLISKKLLGTFESLISK